MKTLRYAMLAVLMLAISGVAQAFTFQVLDPSGAQPGAPFVTPGSSTAFSFYDCPAGLISGDGCFAAVNSSPFVLTSFQATIASSDPITSAAVCPTSYTPPAGGTGLVNAFSDVDTCTVSGNTITVVLGGSPGIQPGSTLWIVETGIPDTAFDPDAGSFSVGATPEPGSIWMALTAMGSLGYVVRRRTGAAKS